MIQTLIGWEPAAFWVVVLLFLSEAQPDSDAAWLAINDKVIHLGLYLVLGGTLSWVGRTGSWMSGTRVLCRAGTHLWETSWRIPQE